MCWYQTTLGWQVLMKDIWRWQDSKPGPFCHEPSLPTTRPPPRPRFHDWYLISKIFSQSQSRKGGRKSFACGNKLINELLLLQVMWFIKEKPKSWDSPNLRMIMISKHLYFKCLIFWSHKLGRRLIFVTIAKLKPLVYFHCAQNLLCEGVSSTLNIPVG